MFHILPRVKFILLVSLLIAASYNISKTTYDIYKSSRRLDELKVEVEAEREENEALLKELEYKQSDVFIEEEARNKLGFVKPGEKLLVTFEDATHGGDGKSVLGASNGGSEVNPSSEHLSEWLGLFFDSK